MPSHRHPRRTGPRTRALVARHRRIAGLAAALFLLLVGGAVALGPTGVLDNLTPTQFEGLAKVGPTDPQLHFPAWYRDRQGISLEACVDPADGKCLAPAGPNFDPAKPLTLESQTPALNNFPDEFFYFNSTSVTTGAGPVTKMLVENNLEGAFANGAPTLGDQMVFARFRVKIEAGLQPSTKYTIVHPYGTADVTTDAGATGIFVTRDVPLAALDFKGALNTRLGPFLQWDAGAPPGYLGDPAVQHRVTNSPVKTNYVALLGPGVGQGVPAANQCPGTVLGKFNVAANDCLYNDQFSLMGKKATRAGVDAPRATYTRTDASTTGTKLEVFAESTADQKIVAQDPDPALRGTANRRFNATILPGANGQYFGHIPAKALPDKVQVVNETDAPATVKDVPVIDIVSGTAVYAAGNLHVVAKSSDQTDAAKLSVATDGAGVPVADAASTLTQALTGTGGTGTGDFAIAPPAAPPAIVIVRSSQGGTAELPVDVSTAPDTPPAPLTADAGADKSIVNGLLEPATVSLIGSGSTGDIATYKWEGPYAVDAGGNLAGQPDTTLGAAPVQSSPQDPNATVAPPAAVGVYGYRLTVSGDAAPASDDMVLTVTAGPVPTDEVITPGTQLYRDDQRRWVINGTDSVVAGNSITVHNGPTAAGQVIGTSPIDTANNYAVDVRGSDIVPAACLCVTLVSKLGNVQTLPVTRPKAPAGAPVAPAAPVAPVAPVAAAAVPGLPVTPVAPVLPVVAAARVAPVPAFAAAALVGAGVPLTVIVPARARVLRLRVLRVPGRARAASAATATGRVLYRAFRVVPAAGRAHTVKFRLRSGKLYSRVRRGGRYVLEVTAGLSHARLGKPTSTAFRVR